jgi:PIN domain nuclease of toxin-antitoxin system
MKYVLDTHALIWFLEGNSRLGTNAKAILSAPDSQLVIPATTLAEAVWIVERGRTSIPAPKDVISVVEADPRVVIYPLDQESHFPTSQNSDTYGKLPLTLYFNRHHHGNRCLKEPLLLHQFHYLFR